MNTHQIHTPKNAILDTQDKPVTFTGPDAIQASQATIGAVTEILNFPMEINDDSDTVYLTPASRFVPNPLTIPERAIVAAFAAHFTKYTPGFERGDTIHFPKVVASPDRDCVDMFDSSFKSESRAYVFAAVVAHTFGLDAEVIETPVGDGWLVAVSAPGGMNGDVFEQLRGACQVVMCYRLEWAEDARDDAEGALPYPDYLRRPESDQRTIVGKLDAILRQLVQIMPSIESPVTVRESGGSIEAHTELSRTDRPAAKTSKGKSKKTA